MFMARDTYEIDNNNNSYFYSYGLKHEIIDNNKYVYESIHELVINNSYFYDSVYELVDNNINFYGSEHELVDNNKYFYDSKHDLIDNINDDYDSGTNLTIIIIILMIFVRILAFEDFAHIINVYFRFDSNIF